MVGCGLACPGGGGAGVSGCEFRGSGGGGTVGARIRASRGGGRGPGGPYHMGGGGGGGWQRCTIYIYIYISLANASTDPTYALGMCPQKIGDPGNYPAFSCHSKAQAVRAFSVFNRTNQQTPLMPWLSGFCQGLPMKLGCEVQLDRLPPLYLAVSGTEVLGGVVARRESSETLGGVGSFSVPEFLDSKHCGFGPFEW